MKEPRRLFDFARYQQSVKPLDVMMTSKYKGEWKPWSTNEFVEAMDKVSRGLMHMGMNPGDKVALISHNNRCEWNIMDAGILQAGGIDVPIYPTMTPEDYVYILNHSESRWCFVSNQELFDKVNSIKDQVPKLEGIYTFEPCQNASQWTEVLEKGKDESNDAALRKIADSIKQDDLATLIYTSGTTGVPKGVMLTHHNITSNAVASRDRLPAIEFGTARTLSFLPVCHIYERMIHYLYMYGGATIYFAESLETIKEDLNLSKPHVFTAVPRLLEKFYDGIVAKGTSAGGIKKVLFEWAVGLALKWEPEGKNGGWYEFKLGLARKLVFSKVKAALGLTEIQAVASGSAALQPRLARFFNGAGIPVWEGYGLTETSPVITVNSGRSPGMLQINTVGKPIADVQIRIAEDGEIQCKGPNVMIGYYKDPERTAEVLKDGWFSTGDIGEITKDGFLRITDRKKEMFKTSGGKYVAPQLIENALKESILIEQVIVVGDGRNFPSALIVPNFDALKTWCSRHEIPYTTDAEMTKHPKVEARIWRDVDKTNQRFGKWEQIKVIRILQHAFTIEGGELTPTMKLKRKPILQKYASMIEEIYTGNDKIS